jgi:hypothetical protein
MLLDYHKIELVMIVCIDYLKYAGDLVENGKGEINAAVPTGESP